MQSIGIGLVGLGRHGMRYARHLLEPLSNLRLVAVCRRDLRQGSAFAKEHGLVYHADYRDLIADSQVQAVVVVTPPVLFPPICREAIRAGKPILIEKPLAIDGREARAMVQAARASGVPLMTAHTLRFDHAILTLKAKLAEVGATRYLALASRLEPRPQSQQNLADFGGRGVLLEIGVHLLDLIRFLTEDEVAEVRCELEPAPSGQGECRALASLRTTDGLACIVDVSRVTLGRVSRVEWVGSAGLLVADWVHHSLLRITSRGHVEQWKVKDEPTVPAALQEFAQAIRNGTDMPVTGLDGQRAVEIADACYESAATGKPVLLTSPR